MGNALRSWPFCAAYLRVERIAFNTLTCFYVEQLRALDCPEIAPAFCQTDNYLAAAAAKRVRFIRTMTLAEGGPACDFCYERARH
jgi:hypothetical protein